MDIPKGIRMRLTDEVKIYKKGREQFKQFFNPCGATNNLCTSSYTAVQGGILVVQAAKS